MAAGEASGDVEVWAIVGRGFGECPASYRAAWRASRFWVSEEKKGWFDAQRECSGDGGKLAELTSAEEISAVRRQLGENWPQFLLAGGVRPSEVKRKDEGWRWYRSRLPILSNYWKFGEPNNRIGNQRFLLIDLKNTTLEFHDISLPNRFLCECHLL